MKWTLKPSVNGSSVEIEMTEDDFKDSLNRKASPKVRSDCLQEQFKYWYSFLQTICDVKEPIEKEKLRYNAKGEPLPSDRQYELMCHYGLRFDNDTTRVQATRLLKESIEKAKKEQKK